jgi:hypothetical protein
MLTKFISLAALSLSIACASAEECPQPEEQPEPPQTTEETPNPQRIADRVTPQEPVTVPSVEIPSDGGAGGVPSVPVIDEPPSAGGSAGEQPTETGNCVSPTDAQSSVKLYTEPFDVRRGDYTVEFWLKRTDAFLKIPGTGDTFIAAMNESWSMNAWTCRYDARNTKSVYCTAYDGVDAPLVWSAPLEFGEWTHIAYVRIAGVHYIYTNGTLSESGPNNADIYERSPISLGQPEGYQHTTAAPVNYGPVRISRGGRYTSDFSPRGTWKIDENTVGQWISQNTLGVTVGDEFKRVSCD